MSNDKHDYKALKPCPFCGSEYLTINHTMDDMNGETVYGNFYVSCDDCDAMIDKPRSTEQEAIDAWNDDTLTESEANKA